MKKLIWIIGGMASGKSTIRRLLTSVLANDERVLISGNGIEVTTFGDLCIVGEAKEEGVCDGLDSSFGRLKKDGALNSTEYAIANYDITILEGSQTSGNWIEPLVAMCKKHDCEFHLILMDITLWQNFHRLYQRILKRGGSEEDMTNKRIESVRSKNNQFSNIYEKCLGEEGINCFKLNTIGRTDEEKVLDCLINTNIYTI